MLRVLTLSTLFPNSLQPTLGVFVERQTLGLAGQEGVELQVVAPVGLGIWPISLHPHYRRRAALPLEEAWKGVRLHRPRYPVLPGPGQGFTAKAMARALLPFLARLRRDFPFDAIDAEFFWPDGPAAMILGKALKVPFLVKARGSDINFWGRNPAVRRQLAAAGAAADRMLAVSGALKREMVALGMPEERIHVHYTGVDLDRFRPADKAAAKAALGLEGPILLCVGALLESKGQRLAIEALDHIPGATLVLAGDGPDRRHLEAQAGRLGLGARVRFLGICPHERIPALMVAADAMMLPSRSEGLANAWVEAMACGTPVITADVGGASEAMSPEAGRLVPLAPAALAAAARALIEAPPDPATVRRSAEKFSWDRNRDQLFAHLSEIAASR